MSAEPQRIVLYSGPIGHCASASCTEKGRAQRPFPNATSPYALRVQWALEEAGAKYQFVSFDMDEKPDWFLTVNPTGKVPTVVYGGPEAPPEKPSSESVTIVESLVLLEFFASLFPDAGLLPKDPVKAAKVRFFMSTLEESLGPALGLWLNNNTDGSDLRQLMEKMQSLLPPEGFAIGEWSIADAALVPFLLFFDLIATIQVGCWCKLAEVGPVKEVFTSPKFARLQKYVADNQARSSLKATWNRELFKTKWLKRFAKNL